MDLREKAMKLCDALVQTLGELGVRFVFGVSGANIEHVHDAVHRLGGSRLRSVLAKHESGAAFMADGYARASCGLGVCCATSGGGMLNLAAGVAEAQASAIPMLALIGQPPVASEGQGGFQDSSGRGHSVNAVDFWRAISKHSVKVSQAHGFWREFHRCLDEALTGRQGAAVMMLPRDVMDLDVGPRPAWFDPPDNEHGAQARALGAVHKTRLMALLQRARRPVLILGEAAGREGDMQPILNFVHRSGIAVASTLGNIAIFPNHHAQYLGSIGVTGHPSAHRYVLEEADLVIAVGTQLDNMTVGPLGDALSRLPLVVINRSIAEVPERLRPALLLETTAREVFSALHETLAERPLAFEPLSHYRITRQAPRLAEGEKHDGTALLQSDALALIDRHLPAGVHLVFDAGNCAAAAAHYLNAPPRSNASIALGMGGMGHGVASAIGIQLARTEEGSQHVPPTVVFCGDGAFLMNGTEIHTAVEQRLHILWIVFNNARHGMCATRQQHFFDSRLESSVFEVPVSAAVMARGLGAPDRLWVDTVRDLEGLSAALGRYFGQPLRMPGVLELQLPIEEVPPFTPFHPMQKAEAVSG
jgi:acetolactate synthase-1/2/3 large subunit